MRRSELYLGTVHEAPEDRDAVAALATRAGLVRRFGSGSYGLGPVGERVRRKVADRIEAGMRAIGGQRVSLPALQPRSIWAESGRWEHFEGEMFTLEDRDGGEHCLAPSHEEGIVHLVDGRVRSHDDLPHLLYQIGAKYRDDRARKGLVRAKEFEMKDAYSLHIDEAGLRETYERVREAYCRIFEDLGVEYAIVEADAGVMGGSRSEEFVALVADGSDDLLACPECRFGVTDEHPGFEERASGDACPDCGADLRTTGAIELGHAFQLGTRYSEAMGLTVDAPDGERYVRMGSYGIGTTRLLQTILEQQVRGRGYGDGGSQSSTGDLDACRWPVTDWGSVAPFRGAIVPIGEGEVRAAAERLHEACGPGDVLLFDDEDQHVGERFAECDLLGVPATVVLGDRFRETGMVEIELIGGERRFVNQEAVPGVMDAYVAGAG